MLKLFDTKRKYTGYDGEEYIDMCIPVLDVNDIKANSIAKLSKDSQGRMDTFVWKSVGEDFNLIDLVMYANHIFNPFAIEEGDVLIVHSNNDQIYRKTDEPTLPDGSKNSNNSKGKKTRTYAETIEYLGRKGLGVK